ncbi:unnamed protein product [Psylliodes chrysocephalus]|uniref:HAT C-terminal dimerisation domain-containing protein n=1 Tax=Psylliodes chrysocephalus TaxID=3402493 RepID=A0A9P0GJ12_9CUCU|nr:unnamed protein product [Psylliodes chrysocephala]
MVYEIDYQNPRNFLPIDDMYFGTSIAVSKIDKNILHSIKVKCLDFYLESTKQILLRFPLKNSAIEKLKFLDPVCVKSKEKHTNLVHPEELQDLDNEWRLLKNYLLDDIENDVLFWKEIANVKIGDSLKFPNLTKFVFQVLCLPHSSAAVERIFSQINLIKTQFRNRLKTETIEGLLYTKSFMENKTCYEFTLNKNVSKKLVFMYF